jgi:HEAT repeat protein
VTTIETLKQSHDIRGLIRLLDHGSPDIQWRAADTLGTMGKPAADPLISILDFHKVHVRIGAIEALGDIRDPGSVSHLARKLKTDPDNEVRWVAALALGQIGDPGAVPALQESLRDNDRYVRYGAVKSLEILGWTPATDAERASALIARQEWEGLRKLGSAAAGPLIEVIKDPNPVTRVKIVRLLGGIGGPDAKKSCEAALQDRDPEVRWTAVLACKRCGTETHLIPLILSERPRTGPSAIGAAVLNLFFFGLGYQYMGKWWGFLVFMSYMTIMVFVQLSLNLLFPYIYIYPFTAVSAVQTYYAVKRMPDM